MPKQNNRKIALVIGIGGVKCASSLGIYRVLQQEGIQIDMVVGTCAGSIYAAGISMGADADTLIHFNKKLWTAEITEKKNWKGFLQSLSPFIFGFNEQFGLRDDRLIMQRLKAFFKDKTFQDTSIPLYIGATDFHSGERIILTEGPMIDAIRGSIAIPFVFSPWKVGNRVLADGFLSDPFPVSVAFENKANIILAVGFEVPYVRRVTSALKFGSQINNVLINNLFHKTFDHYVTSNHAKIIRIHPKFEERIGLFETDKLDLIIQKGEEETLKLLPTIRKAYEQ